MINLAIFELKEAAKRARSWIRWNPWSFLFLAAALVAFLGVLIQTLRVGNMGFQGKSFWDWMELLLVPAVLVLAGYWLSRSQKQTELEITLDRQRQSILDAYLDKMTELILEKELGPDAALEVKRLARTRTIIALRSLDSGRNSQVIRFLRDSELLYPADPDPSQEPVIDLGGADLSDTDLSRVYLKGINLRETDLRRSSLWAASLEGANLRRAALTRTDLTGASLRGADLRQTLIAMAYLEGADLEGANLERAAAHIHQLLEARTLKGATMPDGTKYEEWIKRQETESGEDHEQDDHHFR